MKTYEQLVEEYRKRQHDTVVDTIATGLTYVDEIAGAETRKDGSERRRVPDGQDRRRYGRWRGCHRVDRLLGGDPGDDGRTGAL